MNKKGQTESNVIIAFIVIVIIGVISIAITQDLISPMVEPQQIINEALTTSNVSAVSLAHNDLSANASCTLTPYTTDLSAGTIIWSDTHPSNATLCNYSYYAGSYASSTTRIVTDLIVTLFAVLVLMIIAFFAIKAR